MKKLLSAFLILLSYSAISVGQEKTIPGDWPQFRGPNRDGISTEKGLLKTWPKGGPAQVWKTDGLGLGFSSVSLSGDKIFTMGDIGDTSHLSAINRETGKTIWQTKVGKAGGNYAGTRCTPTVNGGKVYGLGQFGDLVCLDAESGKDIWRKSMQKDFGGQPGGWNYTESLLVYGDKLICTPGGKSNTIVALNKLNGEKIWAAALEQSAGYSSAILVPIEKTNQVVQLLSNELVGVEANTGRVLWRYGNTPERFKGNTANIPTPISWMGRIYSAAGYGRGAGLISLQKTPGGVAANEVYFSKELTNKHGGVVRVGNLIFSDRDDSGNPQCADLATGKIVWRRPRPESREAGSGSASITMADGNLYIRYANGYVALVEAINNGYYEKGLFKIPNSDTNSWNHPVIAGGKLYLREKGVLWCYNVSSGSN